MFRYSRVSCIFSDESMRERRVRKSLGTAGGGVKPLLPSLLASCVPSAELTLVAKGTQGKPAEPSALLNLNGALHDWPIVCHTVQQCSLPDVSMLQMRGSHPDRL